MSKQQSTDTPAKAPQSSIQTPSTENQQTPEIKTEESQNSNLYNMVRKLTTRLKPSKGDDASRPEAFESAEDELAGFEGRNPDLSPPIKEAKKKASLETPESPVRTRTELERLENLILDPTSIKEEEEQEKAKETTTQLKAKRFQTFLEEHF